MTRPVRAALLVLLLALGAAAPMAMAQVPPERTAEALWREGYVFHLLGRYEMAATLFRRSIEIYPTAEGHTFLGWSLSHLGHIEEAIAQCEAAIAVDPAFGNPYNDIGVYLIELGRADEAIPWFDKAIAAPRYCCYQFPHFNKGRVLLDRGEIEAARRHFEQALAHDPDYAPAREGLRAIAEQHGVPL